MINVCREVSLYMESSYSQVVYKTCNICIDEWGRMCHLHIENEWNLRRRNGISPDVHTTFFAILHLPLVSMGKAYSLDDVS